MWYEKSFTLAGTTAYRLSQRMNYNTQTTNNQAVAHCPSFGTMYTGFARKDGFDDAVHALATTEVCFTPRIEPSLDCV